MRNPSESPPSPCSALVIRRLVTIFVPTALVLGLVVLGFYFQDRANEETLFVQTGQYLVDLQTDIINREYSAVESDLLYLADQSILRNFVSGAVDQKTALAHEYLRFCRRKETYDQVRYLDASGREVIRINNNDGQASIVDEPNLQAKAARYYFAQAMRLGPGQVFVSPFDLNVEHEQIERPLKPTIRFATPVFDRRGRKAGVLVLNYLGDALLRKLVGVSSNAAGKSFLLNRAGYFLHGPSEEAEWGFMFGRGPTFDDMFPGVWPTLTSSQHGRLRTPQGLFTFRTLIRQLANASDVSPPTLRVVSYIPEAVLHGRTGQLLTRMLLFYALAVVLILVLAWYLAYAGTLRRYQQLRIEESEQRLRTLSTQLITAQEDERRRLSRDLHDEMGQVVTSMSLDMQRAAQTTEPAKLQELLGRAMRGADALLASIHEISTRLRPTLLDDLGLKDAVQSYLAEYERCTGILPQAVLRFDRSSAPAIVEQNVFRILQEALTNVAKHSRAREVQVDLSMTADQAALTVRDDGVGFTKTGVDGRRLGMLGMRERAELLDGTFVVKSSPGQGTELAITIPIRPAPSGAGP